MLKLFKVKHTYKGSDDVEHYSYNFRLYNGVRYVDIKPTFKNQYRFLCDYAYSLSSWDEVSEFIK